MLITITDLTIEKDKLLFVSRDERIHEKFFNKKRHIIVDKEKQFEFMKELTKYANRYLEEECIFEVL